MMNKFKIFLFKHLFTENEKCLLNQALNLQKQEIKKEFFSGLNCDYFEDLKDVDFLLEMVKNKLWN